MEEVLEVRKSLTALVIGGTGATGKQLIQQLLYSPSYSQVTSLVRKKTQIKSDKYVEVIVNMDELEKHKESFEGKDVCFCCLGTTTKDAGSKEAFRKVDYEYVIHFATLAKAAGITSAHFVSAHVADSKSWFLYSRTKGEADQALKKIGFDRLSIYRPSFLDRGVDARRKVYRWTTYRPSFLDRGVDARTFEKFTGMILPTIPVSTLARAMIQSSLREPTKSVIFLYTEDILELAR